MPTGRTIDNGSNPDFDIAKDTVGGFDYQVIKVAVGADGAVVPVSGANPLPVSGDFLSGGVTDTQLRATPLPVSINASKITTDHIAIAGLLGYAVTWDGNPANAPVAVAVKRFSLQIAASVTDGVVVAAVATKKLIVVSFTAQCVGAAATLQFNSKPGGAGSRRWFIPAGANGGQAPGYSPVGLFETVAGEGISATTNSGSAWEINGTYVEA